MSKPAANAPDQSKHWDDLFYQNLLQCLDSVSKRFPENQAVKDNLVTAKSLAPMKSTFRAKWHTFSAGHIQEIMTCDTATVCKLFDESDNPILSSLGLTNMLMNPKVEVQTKESIWKFLQVLTTLAHSGKTTEITPEKHAAYKLAADVSLKTQKQLWDLQNSTTGTGTATGAATGTAPTPPNTPAAQTAAPAAAGGAPKKPNMKETFEAMIDSMPKFMKQFNDMMKDQSDDNYLGNLARQFVNPGQLQPGFENNIAANMMASQAPSQSVLEDVQSQMQAEGMTPLASNEIMEKLKRLERIESARAKRKAAAKKSGR